MQKDWLNELERCRKSKPYLDFVLTHIDDRMDTRMRDALGADAAGALPLLNSHNITFLIEDPATIWNLGPQRYPAIAERYLPLTARREKLAIDINIVERYQDVYPTKQQTGVELFELVHAAATSFPRVALYFENSLLPPDWKLLPHATAVVTTIEKRGVTLAIESPYGVGVRWPGSAKVDGQVWPVRDDDTVWIPAGRHAVEPGTVDAGPRLLRLNADLKSARITDADTIEFAYHSQSRAIAIIDRAVQAVVVDGKPFLSAHPLLLPHGEHVVSVRAAHP
jgi:hypothetical protein